MMGTAKPLNMVIPSLRTLDFQVVLPSNLSHTAHCKRFGCLAQRMARAKSLLGLKHFKSGPESLVNLASLAQHHRIISSQMHDSWHHMQCNIVQTVQSETWLDRVRQMSPGLIESVTL